MPVRDSIKWNVKSDHIRELGRVEPDNGNEFRMPRSVLSFLLSKGNGHCVNSDGRKTGGKTSGGAEADKVRQKLNEKPLNHLWQRGSAHQTLLLRFPLRLKVMKCAKKTPLLRHRRVDRQTRDCPTGWLAGWLVGWHPRGKKCDP